MTPKQLRYEEYLRGYGVAYRRESVWESAAELRLFCERHARIEPLSTDIVTDGYEVKP